MAKVKNPEKAAATATQKCVGCGGDSTPGQSQPYVGIAQPTDEIKAYQLDLPVNEHGFAAYPVCADCHKDPSHRTRALKMAFFPITNVTRALARAGSNQISAE